MNTGYRIAGVLQTLRLIEEEQERDPDLDYGMNRRNIAPVHRDSSYDHKTPAPLPRRGNGRKQALQERPKSWDILETVWAMAADAALKVPALHGVLAKATIGSLAGGGPENFPDEEHMRENEVHE